LTNFPHLAVLGGCGQNRPFWDPVLRGADWRWKRGSGGFIVWNDGIFPVSLALHERTERFVGGFCHNRSRAFWQAGGFCSQVCFAWMVVMRALRAVMRRVVLFPEAAGVAVAARDAAQSETESNADDNAPDHSVSQA
jgi:hypothetical protein